MTGGFGFEIPGFDPDESHQEISKEDVGALMGLQERMYLLEVFATARPDFLLTETRMEEMFDRVRQAEAFLAEKNPMG